MVDPTTAALWAIYSALYIAAASSRTLLTKSVFAIYEFDYPILFSLLGVITTGLAICVLFATKRVKYAAFPMQHAKTLAWLTVLTGVTMGAQNMAMDLLSVALQQALRGTLPIAVVILEKIIEGKKHSHMIHLCAVPLVLAPVLTSWGTIAASEWNVLGVCCMMGSVVASGAKDVLLHFKIRELKRDIGLVPTLFWLQIGMSFFMLPWTFAQGELTTVKDWEHFGSLGIWAFVLFVTLLGGVRAYTQQLVLTLDSALFLVFCNALIQTLCVFISIPAFHTSMNNELWIGCVLSIFACAMYAAVRKMEKAKAKKEAEAKAAAGEDIEGAAEAGTTALTPASTEDDDLNRPAACDWGSGLFTIPGVLFAGYFFCMFAYTFYLANKPKEE